MVAGTHSCVAGRFRAVPVVVLLLGMGPGLRADHFSGANITYECVGTNQYRVYLDLYLDCAGSPITTHSLLFSNNCGVSFSISGLNPVSSTEVSPLCSSQLVNSRCNGGTLPGFRKYRFQTTLFLSPCNKWRIEWNTCCRNNMVNIALTPGMYAVATLNNAGDLCDRSPVFVDSGIPYVCVNQPVAYNPGVNDPDGHAMTFALISARFAAPAATEVTYQPGFSGAAPIPGLYLSPVTGQIYFTPTVTGYYVVVFEVSTYTSGGTLIGTVMRDLMFAVINCDGTPPQTAGITQGTNGVPFWPSQFIACTGASFCVSLTFTDIPGTVISVQSNATSVLPGSTFSVSGTNPAVATVCWTGDSSILPLTIWFQASDDACPIANTMSTFAQAISCAFLPVELVHFDAVPLDGIVRTEWTTGSESGNERFTVERSGDGREFTVAGSVPGSGNSYQPRTYTFDDRSPLPGTSYYRLRQWDFDGSGSSSSVVSVTRGGAGTITASTDDHSVWRVRGAVPGSRWTLFDTRGALLAQGTFTDAVDAPIMAPDGRGLHLLMVHDGPHMHLLKLPPGGPGDRTTVTATPD